MPARLIAGLTAALLSLPLGVLVGQSVQAWPTYSIQQTPPDLQPAMRRAQLVILAIQGATSAELTREMDTGGSAEAIRVCHLSATALFHRLARDEGIAAGRTAARLRMPANAPRSWAAPIVKQYANAKAAGIDTFVVDLGDKVGVMSPVVHRPACSACHGVAEKLDVRVREELRDRYPADCATGFKDGDLRGWIWVEVPKGH